MIKKVVFGCICFIIWGCSTTQNAQQLTDYVDPFIGVDNDGMTLPGPTLPFSLVKPGPDVPTPNWTTGYRSDKPIDGFSQNHVSGTGGPGRFGNFLVSPQVDGVTTENYSSEKSNEQARPGYYSVFLERWGVKAELSTHERSTYHRYTFPSDKTPYILIDGSRIIKPNWKDLADPKVLHVEMNIVDNQTIEGVGEFVGGWGHNTPYKVYISAKFNQRFAEHGVWKDKSLFAGQDQVSGQKVGTYVSFKPGLEVPVELQIGLSYSSLENARSHLQAAIGTSFEQTVDRAATLWGDVLDRIKVSGGTESQKKIFYTSLYRSFVMPTDITGDNPGWQSDVPHYWDFYCIWDTFRTLNPLFTLVAPDKQVELLRSLLDIYDHRGWLPDAWIAGDYGWMQGGTNADVLFADAITKGLQGFDYKKAYNAIKKNATVPSDRPSGYGRLLDEYNRLGYASANVRSGSSRTLEYAHNDFAIGQVAKALGKEQDSQLFFERSQRSFNLFNPQTKFFWAKDDKGNWMEGFSPTFITDRPYEGPYFYEGTPWHYATYVPHDMAGLIARHGGAEAFVDFLDEMFDGGHYTQNNQPDILTPYLYNYGGRPDKTAERVRYILSNEYHATRDGWPGNDDAGCMSSWYIFSAMGFYPNAGQDLYLIGSPVFHKTEITLSEGKTFTVLAHNTSDKNIYVQSALLNGKALNQAWFRHTDIAQGGQLELVMGSQPSSWGIDNPPPSVSTILTTNVNRR